MAEEYWFENPPKRRGREHRPRVTISRGWVTFGARSPYKGRVSHANPAEGLLMLANKRRKGRKSRAKYIKVRHVQANSPALTLMNRRRKVRRRRHNPAGSAVPASVGGFFSARMLTAVGYGAAGALAPTLVTDTLLPMVGLRLTGMPRRLAQLAVPAAVLALGGKRVLGAGAYPFAISGMAVTAVGLLNDFTGGIAPLSAYTRTPAPLGRYEISAPTLRQ